MFLPFIAVAATAAALFKLGAMSVGIKLLSGALSIMTLFPDRHRSVRIEKAV